MPLFIIARSPAAGSPRSAIGYDTLERAHRAAGIRAAETGCDFGVWSAEEHATDPVFVGIGEPHRVGVADAA